MSAVAEHVTEGAETYLAIARVRHPNRRRTHCPDCRWVMPLHPLDAMTWCPCGWRENRGH